MKELSFVVSSRFGKAAGVLSLLLLGAFVNAQDAVTIPEDPENFHIILLMGQSNMVGARAIDGTMDTETDPRILKLGNLGWELAKDPITNEHDKAVGPGLQFAKKLIEENPDITVGLVPMAVGGTPISFWTPPSQRYLETLHAAGQARVDGVLKGVLWHQGESDTGREWFATHYEKSLLYLIDNLRRDLHDPYLPFIIGGFTPSETLLSEFPYRSVVWNTLKSIGTSFFQCGYVSSKDVPFLPDDQLHFTSEGQRMMGERYADEFLRVIGFWTAEGKEWLDSEAVMYDPENDQLEDIDDSTDEEADDEAVTFGWKYHPELGIYYDEFWPIINHAQLGWLKVSIDQDHVIRLDSPFLGKYRVMQEDGNENAIYIFTEDLTDPENPTYGVPFYVDLTREPGDLYTFYDHSTNTFIDRLPGMVVIEDTWDLNGMVESEFYQTQLAAQLLRNEIAAGGYWSNMRRYVDEVVYHRNYTNYIGWEGYYYSSENETGNLRTFWMDKFFERLYYIDDYVIQAQTDFQSASEVLLGD